MEKIVKELDQLSSKMKSLIKMNDILIKKLQQSNVSSLACGNLIDNKKNSMEKIPTAEEILNDRVYITQDGIEDVHDSISTVAEAMIEFAKLHVEAALKEASATDIVSGRSYKHRTEYDKSSILNSYPLENIK